MRATRSFRVALLPLAMASALTTSGCDGGGSAAGHPPAISDLHLSSPAVVDGAGRADVSGSLSFRDPGGDVAYLTLSSELATTTIPVTGASGATSGSGGATITVAPGRYGTQPFEIWIVDRAGNESNHLSGLVSFVPDDGGATWTQVSTLPVTALVQAAGPGHATFVAVGPSGLILTSQDGTHWTQQPSPVTADLNGVAWSGARFVAVGDGSTVVSSEDGYSWSIRTVPAAATPLYAVSWGGAFVAVGGGLPPVAVRSTDGAAWMQGTGLEPTDGYDTPLYGVAFGAGRWVAVGQARWASSDGESWSRAPVDYAPSASFTVAWNGVRFLTAGVDVGASPDGLTWTLATSGPPAGYPTWGLAWSGYHWLILGSDAASTSADGFAWDVAALETAPFATPPRVLWDADSYPARYLAASASGIWTSP